MTVVSQDSLSWQGRGECAQAHSNVSLDDFFYEGVFRPNSKEQRVHIERLRNICSECVVFDECRQFVNGTRQADGFWAGETEDERRARWYRETVVPVEARPVTTKGAAKL